MCGIAGIFNLSGRHIDKRMLEAMAAVLRHRGPDDEGYYLSKNQNLGLAHRRLSIIDLQTGHQPISNEDESIWLIFNGEIYNFIELKDELTAKGHIFKTKTDTESILHLYEEYGNDCIKKLRGMFAFALWDDRKECLLLARDRAGKKPLSYYFDGNMFAFASEIKSILELDSVSREVEILSLHQFLTLGYVASPNSMFKKINKLPPAHMLIINRDGLKVERYWELDYSNKLRLNPIEYEERIIDILKEAVKIRLISDVPLGAFLSGGIDSSAVVALMSQYSDKPVKTFTIGFDEADYSELEYARIIAKKFGTDHHEFIVKPNAVEILPKLVWHYNEPFGDSSCVPTYYVAKMTRQHVTVALNGDGGDENFAGYHRYKGIKIAGMLEFLPRSFLNFAVSGMDLMSRASLNNGKNRTFSRARNFFEALASEPSQERRYARWVSYFYNQQKEHLYTKEFKEKTRDNDSYNMLLQVLSRFGSISMYEKVMAADVLTYLPEDLLVKMDIACMANSLEGRSPFLDHHLMEFAARIPANLKLRGLTSKYILRKTMAKILPKPILERRKMGFGVPIGHWFKNELKDYVYENLLSAKSLSRGYFKRESILSILDEHISGRQDHSHRIWSLLNLELWHRMFIDKTLKP